MKPIIMYRGYKTEGNYECIFKLSTQLTEENLNRKQYNARLTISEFAEIYDRKDIDYILDLTDYDKIKGIIKNFDYISIHSICDEKLISMTISLIVNDEYGKFKYRELLAVSAFHYDNEQQSKARKIIDYINEQASVLK